MGEARHIENQAEDATSAFLRRSSITYLEVCIAVMLTHMPLDEVVGILEQEARDLRDFG